MNPSRYILLFVGEEVEADKRIGYGGAQMAVGGSEGSAKFERSRAEGRSQVSRRRGRGVKRVSDLRNVKGRVGFPSVGWV